jgi:hypothetical protein
MTAKDNRDSLGWTGEDYARLAKVTRIMDNPPGHGIEGYRAKLDAALDRAKAADLRRGGRRPARSWSLAS